MQRVGGRLSRRWAVGLALVALVAAAGLGAWSLRARPAARPAGLDLERLDDYGRLPPFSLLERTGDRVGLEDLRGLVWVANFIYTQCRETCPTQSLALARLQQAFAADERLRLVSITVDPEHDTPAVLRRYAERYGAGPRWWFLTGDRTTIFCLATEGFRLAMPADDPAPDCRSRWSLGPGRALAHHRGAEPLMHSARLVLVDGQARLRAYHTAQDAGSADRLADNVRRLLDEAAGRPVAR